jgi:uncharacterized membrane protein YidH (DUF202 family)
MELLPALDPIPLPAPVWLFKLLHTVTLALHFGAVHLLVGGLFFATLWSFLGQRGNNAAMVDASRVTGYRLPVVMAFVVNLGIPPLLFAQVLYGRALYTSSVLIGVYWLSVVFLVMFAYYLLYMIAKRAESSRAFAWVGLFAIIAVLKVGYIYSANMTLMLAPESWAAMYRENPLGSVLATGPAALPRWAYMMIGSLGVSGIGFLLLGIHSKVSPETGSFLTRQGGRFLALFTIVQAIMGFVVYSAQSDAVRAGLSGSPYYLTLTAIWALTAVLLIVVGLLAARASATPRWPLAAGAGALSLVNILAMAGFRDGIRDITLTLKGYDVWSREVNTNWLTVGLFLLLFVAAGVAIGWLTRVVFLAKGESASYG